MIPLYLVNYLKQKQLCLFRVRKIQFSFYYIYTIKFFFSSGTDFAIAYVDDILMKNKSLIEHKEHVHKVLFFFTKIQDYSFKFKETK